MSANLPARELFPQLPSAQELFSDNSLSSNEWSTYRTRFLVRATQLTQSLVFTDSLGREHRGTAGDYLVQSSEGLFRVAPKEIFEDVYVPLEPSTDQFLSRHLDSQLTPESLSA